MGAAVAASVDANHATMTIVINRDMRISVCVLTVSGAPGVLATGALYATNVQKNSKPTAVAPIFFLIFSPVSAVTFPLLPVIDGGSGGQLRAILICGGGRGSPLRPHAEYFGCRRRYDCRLVTEGTDSRAY